MSLMKKMARLIQQDIIMKRKASDEVLEKVKEINESLNNQFGGSYNIVGEGGVGINIDRLELMVECEDYFGVELSHKVDEEASKLNTEEEVFEVIVQEIKRLQNNKE